MTILSKYFDRLAAKYENSGLAKQAFSYAVVGTALFALTIKVTVPYIKGTKPAVKNGTLTPSIPSDANDDLKLAEAEKLLVEKHLKKKSTQMLEPGLNKEFLKQLGMLGQIMIPQKLCYETGLLTVHTLCLISRTFLSIYVAALEGAIVKFIVRKDLKQFTLVLLKWFGIAIPATFVNSMIRFLESKLALAFR